MAVQNVSSTQVTNADADPVVFNDTIEHEGRLLETAEVLALTSTQADGDSGSVWRMVRVPASARISNVAIINDDLEGATPSLAVDLGLYEVDGGAVKDADFFASAVTTLQAATTAWTDLTYESGVVDPSKVDQPLWQQLGDADTPQNRDKFYDIAFTVTTAAGANPQAGDVAIRVQYVKGN